MAPDTAFHPFPPPQWIIFGMQNPKLLSGTHPLTSTLHHKSLNSQNFQFSARKLTLNFKPWHFLQPNFVFPLLLYIFCHSIYWSMLKLQPCLLFYLIFLFDQLPCCGYPHLSTHWIGVFLDDSNCLLLVWGPCKRSHDLACYCFKQIITLSINIPQVCTLLCCIGRRYGFDYSREWVCMLCG